MKISSAFSEHRRRLAPMVSEILTFPLFQTRATVNVWGDLVLAKSSEIICKKELHHIKHQIKIK
jgi:hypothetical protein